MLCMLNIQRELFPLCKSYSDQVKLVIKSQEIKNLQILKLNGIHDRHFTKHR